MAASSGGAMIFPSVCRRLLPHSLHAHRVGQWAPRVAVAAARPAGSCGASRAYPGQSLASTAPTFASFVKPSLGSGSVAVAPGSARGGITAMALGSVRGKQTKRQSYHKPPRASPCSQRMPNKAHIGVKALPAEYVEVGRMICKQRKYIAKNPNVTRKRHFKLYPGVNVKVMKSTSLQAAVSGRVKMTHDVQRGVLIMNVLAEPREELLRDDLWRYRTEHVESMEENKLLVHLRSKALPVFGKDEGWVNQPVGPKPMKVRISHRNACVKCGDAVLPCRTGLPCDNCRKLLPGRVDCLSRMFAGQCEQHQMVSMASNEFGVMRSQSNSPSEPDGH